MHPEIHREAVRQCRRTHRRKTAKWQTDYMNRLRKRVLDAYGGKCALCGEDRLEKLTLDHVNADGREHRERLGGRRRWQKVLCRSRKIGSTNCQFPRNGFSESGPADWKQQKIQLWDEPRLKHAELFQCRHNQSPILRMRSHAPRADVGYLRPR